MKNRGGRERDSAWGRGREGGEWKAERREEKGERERGEKRAAHLIGFSPSNDPIANSDDRLGKRSCVRSSRVRFTEEGDGGEGSQTRGIRSAILKDLPNAAYRS